MAKAFLKKKFTQNQTFYQKKKVQTEQLFFNNRSNPFNFRKLTYIEKLSEDLKDSFQNRATKSPLNSYIKRNPK